jgi:hypothetical protein
MALVGASTRGMRLAVIGLARLFFIAKKSLEAIAASSLAQARVANPASNSGRSDFARQCFYPLVYESIEGSGC